MSNNISEGINIYSGESGLGAALTNPTELAKRKGGITRSYPIRVDGALFGDVEIAYFSLRTKCQNDQEIRELMTALIAIKLQTYPELQQAITDHGGVAWLQKCTHYTSSNRQNISTWEGDATSSKFIQLLIQGYLLSLSTQKVVYKQDSLF